ncbi:probable inactive histone-lysine N-methyltransferase SUVR2 isoform X5 [Ziziphus jujuba]|uniref:Probable inactive histone-lysine N-methyltransferase SUVR2 isoform X5 n=1 Tax=Ziziphus jujuba TaxID=326968 RepID=A0ABM3IQL9_ZIZJJ|nr:probable inactive histone-lysine N-methyltransferase SUVR2 isoform X5 [Ziziphus jujuba]
MAPNKKIVVADACRAMEQYGIPKIKTKAVMRELLKLYGTSWELIVQEGYKVLIDALFDKQEEEERGKYNKTIAYVGENSKAAKSKDKEVPHDKPEVELPSKRLRTRSQIKQALSQEEFAKSNLAKIGSEQKDQNVADFDSDTELEDPAPLVRTKCSRNQDELALVPMDNPVSLVVGEDELSWTYCMAEATQPPVSDEQSHSEPEVHLSTDRYRIKQDFLQEGYSKSCLPITASKSEHHNVVHLHSDSDSKVEDPEPLLRRKRSRHQNERALVSVDNPVLVDLGKGELSQNCCSEEVAEVTQPHVSDKKSPSTSDSHLAQQYLRKEGMTQSSPVEKTELSQTYPRSASPQCEEKNSKILEADCRDNTCNSDGGNDLTPATDVLDLYHNNSLDMLGGERFVDNQLKNEVPLAVIISDGSVGEVSQVEADDLKFLKTKSLDVEDRGGLLKEKFLEECISVNQELKGHDCYGNKCKAESSRNIKRSVASKGHPRRKFIKECWSKCECSKNCGNRVVQRGMTVNLQVYWTPEGKGWGLRTLEHLPRGAFVCEYVGEIVTDVELQQRYMQSVGIEKPVYHVLLDAGYGSEGVRKDEESLCLDATYYGNVARFINHRCSDASLIEIPVEVETPDRSYYHVALFTTRKVNAREELTWDYGIDFEHHNRSMRAFRCFCGSSYCRNPN